MIQWYLSYTLRLDYQKGPLGIQGFSSGDYKDERHDKNVDMQDPSKLVQLHSRWYPFNSFQKNVENISIAWLIDES